MQPEDLFRQSMPFSYLYITTETNDGNLHNVRLYSDISGGKKVSRFVTNGLTSVVEFLQDQSSTADIKWASQDDGTNIILSERLAKPLAFTERENRAADAIEYYCYKRAGLPFNLDIHVYAAHRNDQINRTTTSWQISSSNITRNAAANMKTSLNNTADAGQTHLNK